MNRTDRLLAIILELQAAKQLRAEDLASIFETSVRTIYRDMQALAEAGVPIVSMTGQGYSLMEGYFLPPLRFSTEEAIMLLLGADFVTPHFDERYRAAASAASRKIEAVLPEPLRAEVRELQASIRLVVDGVSDEALIRLQQLRRAIIERRRVQFQYHARSSGEAQRREVEPYGLVHYSAAWYLMAYDPLRQAVRHFRLDRMDDLKLSEKHFTRSPEVHWSRELNDERKVKVTALFDDDVARWVRETRNFFTVKEEDTPDGLLVTLLVRDIGEVLNWLLSWGRHVRVLEPATLRQRLIDEAEAILKTQRQRE